MCRYCIYSGRKKYAIPSVEYLKSLIKDELKYKYNGNKILAYADIQEEQSAIAWLRTQMGWTLERPPHAAFDPH